MSQGSVQVPTSGTESATTFAGQVNTALAALLSGNSGATAPANGPGGAAVQFQQWWDQSVALFPKRRWYDSANWDFDGSLDIAGSNWLPKLGGGIGTIVSASTCDIGSQPQGFLTITGTTTITSFGSSLTNGEFKRCYASGAFVIQNGANIVCPGGANITVVIGDIFEVMSDGGGVAFIMWYQRGAGVTGIGKPTGEIFAAYLQTAPAGSLKCDASTIGATSSGATFTGPQYFNLYSSVWTNSVLASATVTLTLASPGVVNWTGHGLQPGGGVVFATTGALPTGLVAGTIYFITNDGSFGANSFHVSDTQAHALAGTNQINFTGSQSGTQTANGVDPEITIGGTGRGLTALADWTALKTMKLPDLRGRVIAMTDGSGRLTGTSMTPGAAIFSSVGGAETVTLSTANLPVHAHTITAQVTGGESATHTHTFTGTAATNFTTTGASPSYNTSGGTITTSTESVGHTHSLTGTTDSNGSGTAHLNVQPTKLLNYFIVM